MGKTSRPLIVWVDPVWWDRPEIQALRDQGHIVNMTWGEDDQVPDLILSRAAHGWSDDLWKFLPLALIAARKRKRALIEVEEYQDQGGEA